MSTFSCQPGVVRTQKVGPESLDNTIASMSEMHGADSDVQVWWGYCELAGNSGIFIAGLCLNPLFFFNKNEIVVEPPSELSQCLNDLTSQSRL